MKDTTPILEADVALRERERLGIGQAKPSERVGLETEERMRKRYEKFVRYTPVATDILEEARSALAIRFRFLDRALWRMPLEPCFDMYGIASDGYRMVFDPVFVVDRFNLSQNEVVRDVVHCLFHCIFRHPFMLYSVLRQPWDVACDIAIESMLLDLVGEAFPSNMDRRARQSLRVLRAQAGGVITAERLYHLFSNTGSHVDLNSLAPIFRHDAHGLWHGSEEEPGREASASAAARDSKETREGSAPARQSGTEELDEISQGLVAVPRPEAESEPDDAGGASGAGAQDAQSGDDADASQGAGDSAGSLESQASEMPSQEDLAREWEQLSRQIQVELETHLARQGEGAGDLIVGLRAVNREKHDYASFLKRFAMLHERMKVNDDEFDYIYYTYGLSRYGNMPLIEPLEYKEDRQVKDFVIAIDTSESCSGDLVQGFMRKTYNILKQSGSFASRVNVHIVQCDARVQDDTKVTSTDELELYLKDMQHKGFGGTDFRPVFDYVNLLIEKGELTDLRGLVYFTDGEGTYPRRPPAYDAVFVFLDDGYSDPKVPPWALKVILDENELEVE